VPPLEMRLHAEFAWKLEKIRIGADTNKRETNLQLI